MLITLTLDTTAPLTGGGALSSDLILTISDFVASGASHARGAVPDPGAVLHEGLPADVHIRQFPAAAALWKGAIPQVRMAEVPAEAGPLLPAP